LTTLLPASSLIKLHQEVQNEWYSKYMS
jgi:hypothetical protein